MREAWSAVVIVADGEACDAGLELHDHGVRRHVWGVEVRVPGGVGRRRGVDSVGELRHGRGAVEGYGLWRRPAHDELDEGRRVPHEYPAPMSAEAIAARKSCYVCLAVKAASIDAVAMIRRSSRAEPFRKGAALPSGEKAAQTSRSSSGHGNATSHVSQAAAKLRRSSRFMRYQAFSPRYLAFVWSVDEPAIRDGAAAYGAGGSGVPTSALPRH